MRTDQEKAYLIKAINAFKRRFLVVSPEFKILAASSPLDQMDPEELVGQFCYDVFHDRSSPCQNCAVVEVLEGGQAALMPQPEDPIDLSRVPCYYAYPIFDAQGEIDAFVSMDFDLPTRGGLEEKMQRSNALLRNLILSAVDGVIAADKTGKIIIFNQAASTVFGYTEEEALTQVNIRDIYPEKVAFKVMRMLRSDEHGGPGKLRGYQVNVAGKDGSLIPIRLNASIVFEAGEEVATIGFFHDLRHELEMEKELKKTQLQLLQAEKMASLGKLAAGVAHQLNNPLGGIILFAKLLMEEYRLPEGAPDDVQRILRDAERCRDTVKELLEFTRQTRQFMKPCDLNAAIERTLFLLENQTLFHNIEIRKELSSELPKVTADSQQLGHLLMNIILNAAQAMKGRGALTIKSYPMAHIQRVAIEIGDTGPGIPEDIIGNIFEPFFTTKEEGEGTGLGLSLVYGIVENHGGTIYVRNNSDLGVTFVIELPLSFANADEGEEREN